MKLHPLSVPYRIAQGVVGVGWIFFVAVVAVPQAVGSVTATVFALGSLVILTLAAVAAWQVAYYRRYEYALTGDTFDIDSGVLSRRSREIPYGRIQNVAINRNVVQRALGLAELRIETAGGSEAEAHLRYVSREEASRLQDELSERKRSDREPTERAGTADGEEAIEGEQDAERTGSELLFEIAPRELGVLGFVSLLDPRLIPLMFFAIVPFLDLFGNVASGTGGLAVLVLPILIVVLYLVIAAFSAAYSVTNYYDFRLVRTGDELRYERGLLQKFSGTIPLAKVQALTITENPLARLVDHASLNVETAGFSPGEAGGQQAAVPIAQRDRVTALATEIEPVDVPAFERPPKRARQRYFFRYLGVLAILVAIAYGTQALGYWPGPWYATAALVVLVPVAAHLKWRNLGWALTDEYVVTRHGFWNRTTKVVPYHRVQTVADTQTIFQRKRRLATLRVDVAGSQSLVSDDSKAVDIDRDVADELRETIADRLLTSLEDTVRPEDRTDLGGFVSAGSDAIGGDVDGT